MTWANLLTSCRLALVPLCAFAIVAGDWQRAAVTFAIAVGTDLLDGPVARRLGQSTPLGGLFDHATDATFVATVMGACAVIGIVPWLLPLCIVAAFLQYAIDSRALTGRTLRASSLGRWNGVAYFVLAGFVIGTRALLPRWSLDTLWTALAWLLVASTLVSMADRALAPRRQPHDR
jgi:CDP-diacylglycerol--glycerol-3-phosphate 3-phosphatidyltransferase